MKIFKKIKIADMITLGNGVCGFLAMLSFKERWGENLGANEPFFLPGIALIVLGMIFDGLDGMVARWELKKYGVKNTIGHYLDSISDTITFCLAPAYLLYSVYRVPWQGLQSAELVTNIVIILAAVLVALFGILRLAKFVSSGHELDIFMGLPTPANAFIVCVLCFLFEAYWWITIPAAIVLAFLMISDHKYPKVHGRARLFFGGLIFMFVISLFFRLFNVRIWHKLTNLELFGYNIAAALALAVALFYAFGSPIIMELKERKLVDIDLERDL